MEVFETISTINFIGDLIHLTILMAPFIGMGLLAVWMVTWNDPEFVEWDNDKHK